LRAQAMRIAPNIHSDHINGAGHFAHRDAPRQFATSVLRAVTNTP
jgi:pimeloyl-ACP methyl ester carboxylesterase